ncbi:initiator tRNA phosphoribosyl transferase-domain-containing protein [Naematelia encephala]|uniref:Initiator tRNA phosphoribosyl transferase-domain-containing protein n=1 Tax=Naematelia encephala TaxID=71784 RepID=A0A1Y2AUQ4_9TREE|nr:initiator tRNA phosphoribosyl transferase-domain-containing protein [Naematelia encephala]
MSAQAKAIRKQTAQHDLFNRLHSIAADEAFVRQVAHDWYEDRFDVIANQRCGNWYCDPSTSATAYAYFKSTDGHTNNWDFNLRRSNLPFATIAADRGGVILVDSTRRGKRMPDALSKTVPVWCTVINRAVGAMDPTLYLPPSIVSPSEASQIEDRLQGWVDALKASSLPLPKLAKPLRPFFIHPATSRPPEIPEDPPYIPIICLSASRQGDVPSATRVGTRTVGFEYVSGAGDDDELWARGLTPKIFHRHKTRLLESERDELEGVVDEIVGEDGVVGIQRLELNDCVTAISPRLALDIGPPVSPAPTAPTATLHVVLLDKHPKPHLHRIPGGAVLALPSARSDGPGFSRAIDEAVQYVRSVQGVVLLCPAHRELLDKPDAPSIDRSDEARKGILPLALVLLCTTSGAKEMTKPYIASQLHTLVAQWPDGNPPRAALKRVNEYLMSPQHVHAS